MQLTSRQHAPTACMLTFMARRVNNEHAFAPMQARYALLVAEMQLQGRTVRGRQLASPPRRPATAAARHHAHPEQQRWRPVSASCSGLDSAALRAAALDAALEIAVEKQSPGGQPAPGVDVLPAPLRPTAAPERAAAVAEAALASTAPYPHRGEPRSLVAATDSAAAASRAERSLAALFAAPDPTPAEEPEAGRGSCEQLSAAQASTAAAGHVEQMAGTARPLAGSPLGLRAASSAGQPAPVPAQPAEAGDTFAGGSTPGAAQQGCKGGAADGLSLPAASQPGLWTSRRPPLSPHSAAAPAEAEVGIAVPCCILPACRAALAGELLAAGELRASSGSAAGPATTAAVQPGGAVVSAAERRDTPLPHIVARHKQAEAAARRQLQALLQRRGSGIVRMMQQPAGLT